MKMQVMPYKQELGKASSEYKRGWSHILFLVAIFSFYLAFAGMRFAKNRKGIPTKLDWIAVGLMVASGVGMLSLSLVYFVNGNSQYIVLLVFGLLAVLLGGGDYRSH